jgi:hypothetical protein
VFLATRSKSFGYALNIKRYIKSHSKVCSNDNHCQALLIQTLPLADHNTDNLLELKLHGWKVFNAQSAL